MPRKAREKVRVQYSKVITDLLEEIRDAKPQYEGMDLKAVADMELRERLFEEKRKLKNQATAQGPLHNSPVVWNLNDQELSKAVHIAEMIG